MGQQRGLVQSWPVALCSNAERQSSVRGEITHYDLLRIWFLPIFIRLSPTTQMPEDHLENNWATAQLPPTINRSHETQLTVTPGIGPPGLGKTHVATAIAVGAIQRGYRALVRSSFELAQDFTQAEATGERPNSWNSSREWIFSSSRISE